MREERPVTIDSSILQNNAEQLARLESLELGPEDLKKNLGEDWTVSVALAHLAFWDRRAVGLLRQWDGEGRMPDSVHEDPLNDALLDEWLAIEPARSYELAVDAAHKVNAAVEALDGSKAKTLIETGNRFMLARGEHRREHLDQIEEALR